MSKTPRIWATSIWDLGQKHATLHIGLPPPARTRAFGFFRLHVGSDGQFWIQSGICSDLESGIWNLLARKSSDFTGLHSAKIWNLKSEICPENLDLKLKSGIWNLKSGMWRQLKSMPSNLKSGIWPSCFLNSDPRTWQIFLESGICLSSKAENPKSEIWNLKSA